MSTKTIYKRIALVAVTALGAGVLSVAPASAADVSTTAFTTAVTSTAAATAAAPAPQGTAIVANLRLTTGAAMASGDKIRATYTLTDPTGRAVTDAVFTATAGAIGTNGTAALLAGQAIELSASGAVANAAYTIGTITFTPTMGGVYALTNTQTLTQATASVSTTLLNGTTNATTGAFYVSGISVTQGTTRGNPGAAVVGNQAQVRITYPEAEGTTYRTVSTGVGSILGATPTDAVNTNISGLTTDFSRGFSTVTTTDQTAHNNVVTLASTVAGDQTITVTTVDPTTGIGTALYSIVITWGAASAVSTQYSLVKLLAGAVTTDVTAATADTTATTVSQAAGTQYFTIQIETNDQNDVAMAGHTLGASIAGPGLIGISAGRNATTATGRSLTVAQAAGNAFGSVSVWGDGSAGSATITITATNAAGVTTTLGTKTVRFAGPVARATVTQNLFVARAATQLGLTPTTSRVSATSAATTPALRASVVDAAGVAVVAGATVRLVSSNTAVITAGSCAEYTTTGSTTAAVPAPGTFECSVSGASSALSGQTATITFQVLNPATGLYDIAAAPITFAIGGSIASTVVAVNKTSYLPGEAIVMTATAKDSSGNNAFDGQNPYATVASANMSVGGAFPATTAFIVNGVHSTTVAGVNSLFAPASTGTLTVTGLTAATTAAPAGAAYTASVTIANAPDAAITAITTLVNSLIAKINALNKLVIKIQKKVRA